MAIDLNREILLAADCFTVRIQEYDGPLDVLLHLIREQEMDIYNIPIASITDQYLAYLRALEELDLNIAGEYILMAATLMEMKSRLLLPKPPAPEPEEGPDPRDELVRRLLEYEKYKEVASLLQGHEAERRLLYTRTVEVDPDDLPPVPSGAVTTLDLLAALKKVLQGVGESREPVATIPRQRITLRMKMSEILRRVRESGERLAFTELFSTQRTRTDVVVAFLALLELLRLGRVAAEQDGRFGEIYISAGREPDVVSAPQYQAAPA